VVPGLDTTRAATSVELRDGQSFAIAGLFSKDTTRSVNQIPGLGEIPVLGALFKSGSWQRNETELVIIVTPHLISPSDSVESLPDPLRGIEEPGIIDLILAGKGFGLASKAPIPPPAS
jgi:pilus assembly protein CpaC